MRFPMGPAPTPAGWVTSELEACITMLLAFGQPHTEPAHRSDIAEPWRLVVGGSQRFRVYDLCFVVSVCVCWQDRKLHSCRIARHSLLLEVFDVLLPLLMQRSLGVPCLASRVRICPCLQIDQLLRNCAKC